MIKNGGIYLHVVKHYVSVPFKKVNYNLYVWALCSTFEEIELCGAFQSEILSLHSGFGL